MIITIDKNKIKKVLVLEDDLNRIAWFRTRLIGLQVTYVDDANLAIVLLERHKYDLIFLDHDLGGKQMVDISDSNNGSRVAEAIRDLGIKSQVFIHSFNTVGVDYMHSILPLSIVAPFKTFEIDIIYNY